MNTIYNPPQLTPEEKEIVRKDCEKWFNTHGVMQFAKLMPTVIYENARLVKEINELRGMLEISPMATYSLNGGK